MELFNDAVQVSRVRVVDSMQVSGHKEGIAYDCGFDYGANVVVAFKGSGSDIMFRSFSKLVVGEEYFDFFQ